MSGVAAALLAVGIVLTAVVVWLFVSRLRRTRRLQPSPVRDAPTVAHDDPLGRGLAGTRRALGARLAGLFGGGPAEADWEELEEALLAADVGVAATASIVGSLRDAVRRGESDLRAGLRRELIGAFAGRDRSLRLTGSPAVIVVVGVNGSGKTTTIAKLGARLAREGSEVLLGAADTFRAAATEQLTEWAQRTGLDIVAGQQGADPASVAFDALSAARARGKDVLVVDTAGRLHSKHNLMQELGKVVRVLERESEGVGEVLLVLDGTTGQNAVAQARTFTEAVGVTGIALTKMDGTARGGIVVAVERELGIPVKFIGVGEQAGDLLSFEATAFVDALLGG